MTTKSMLLAVKEPQTLIEITQALGAGWRVMSVASEADTVAQVETGTFDAVLVDFNFVSPDASELLNQVLQVSPQTVRFLLAYEADLALVAAEVLGTPHILPKPIESVSLKNRIESALSPWDSETADGEPATSATEAPVASSIFADVLKTLELPDATKEQVGGVIARDEILTLEILRLTNSSYLGMPRKIADPVDAVESLGLETVKAAVMALQFLNEHKGLRSGYLSLDQLWQHSVNTAQIARDLVLFETKDRALASQALAAGLLHDLGKVVLAKNFEDLYGRVHSLSRKQPVAIWDIEKEMFGATHGEIGACLVGMWNLPIAIVNATALHHEPPSDQEPGLTPLAAVHIADVLAHEFSPGDDKPLIAPVINTTFLNQLGLLQRLPVWRAAFGNRMALLRDSKPESQPGQPIPAVLSNSSTSRTGNDLPAPVSTTRTATAESSPASASQESRTWVLAMLGGILLLTALLYKSQFDSAQAERVYARARILHDTRAAGSTIASKEVPPPAQTDVAPVAASPEPAEAPAPAPEPTVAEEHSAPTLPVPAPVTDSTPASSRAGTHAVSESIPTVVEQQKPAPQFKLNGIIYSATRPSAIVNGQMVYAGDQVDGADVIEIKRTAVTLQIDGQRKTFILK